MERLCLDETAKQSVDDYLEYRRIVGDDDGGKLFTPEQYEKYKREVVPQRTTNRLYVSYGVPGGIDCKLPGPETQCFCTHRYKQHKTDFEAVPSERPLALPCRVPGCRCLAYEYLPVVAGSQPVRCRCKHTAQDHSETAGHTCMKCSSCSGFRSPYTCGCGQPSSNHQTLVETRQERAMRGRPVGGDVPYMAMGGLTGFSSLADGYLRLDHSGAGIGFSSLADGYLRLDHSGTGAPPISVLSPEQSGSFHPHLFEKAYGTTSSSVHRDPVSKVNQSLPDTRTREEKDMAYFESCYQERLKAEKMSSRANRAPTKPSRALPGKKACHKQ